MIRISDYDLTTLRHIVNWQIEKGYSFIQRNGVLYFYTVQG